MSVFLCRNSFVEGGAKAFGAALVISFGSLCCAQESGALFPANPTGAEARAQALAEELSGKWQSFQKDLAASRPEPVERIRRVEEWQAREKIAIDAEKHARGEAARSREPGPVPSSATAAHPMPDSDPREAEADEIDAEILEVMRSADAHRLSPADRIFWVDDLLELNADLLERRDQLRRSVAADRFALQAHELARPASPAARAVRSGRSRRAQITEEMQSVLDSVDTCRLSSASPPWTPAKRSLPPLTKS